MNFVICGLPRSGTTIIARFVGGLPGVFVQHEPLQCLYKYGKTPLRGPVTELHYGIKEPFHTNPKIAAYCNRDFLEGLRDEGWHFIYVSRDGFGLAASLARWGVDSDTLLEMHKQWDQFRNLEPTFHYDSFIRNPVGYWNMKNPIGVLATEVRLADCPDPFMGDHRARNSTSIFGKSDTKPA